MEYLVTMTTRVPGGTPADEVDHLRGREAAQTRQPAARGRVLRLWRPPPEPGEWRSIGLFAADDSDGLERTLASMPLRVWRTDEVTALGPHPDDPGRGRIPLSESSQEFLVTLVVEVPYGTSGETLEEMTTRDDDRAGDPAAQSHLVRLWRLPGEGRNLGLWHAAGAGQMRDVLRSLPLADWLTVETVPLTRHPGDPASVPGSGVSSGSTA
ncbi:muconolactone Delta-isomerase family protein [Streptomyces xylophagus]|uniref:muconolactone Delta-isomerase family protein n=1 Tax=Streptomyces xylophagus TaxID=285514 RepID=UPI0005B95D24|nr:muconolactone Delta-isomerase family protein [Streptomyces xylophagus]